MTAAQAGTTIRFFISKLLASEKTAVKLFDAMNLSIEGTKLTFEDFSNIAKDDVNDAIQILLDNFGKLSAQQTTLQKLFTARHWTKISALLASMGGSVQKFTEEMTTSNDVSEDYEKQLKNLNTQMELFKGKLENANSELTKLTKDMMMSTLPALNAMADSAAWVNKTFLGTILKAGLLSASITAIGAALIKLLVLFKASSIGLSLSGAMFSTLAFGIGAALTGVIALWFAYLKINKISQENADLLLKQNQARKENIRTIEIANRTLDEYAKVLETLDDIKISSKWEEELNYIDMAKAASKEYSDFLKSTSKLELLNNLEKKKRTLENMKLSKKAQEEDRDKIKETIVLQDKNRTGIRYVKALQEEGGVNKKGKIVDGENFTKTIKRFIADMKKKKQKNFNKEDYDDVLKFSKEMQKTTSQISDLIEKFPKLMTVSSEDLQLMKEVLDNNIASHKNAVVTATAEYKDAEAKLISETTADVLKSREENYKLSKKIFAGEYETFSDFEDEIKLTGGVVEENYNSIMNDGLRDAISDKNDAEKLSLINSDRMLKDSVQYLKLQEHINIKEKENVKLAKEKSTDAKFLMDANNAIIKLDKDSQQKIINNIATNKDALADVDRKKELLSDIYKIEDLSYLKAKNTVDLMDSGLAKMKASEVILKNKLTAEKELIKNYNEEKTLLEEKASKGTIVGDELKFNDDKQQKEYEKQLKIVEDMDDVKKEILKTEHNIAISNKNQTDYTTKLNEELESVQDKLDSHKKTNKELLDTAEKELATYDLKNITDEENLKYKNLKLEISVLQANVDRDIVEELKKQLSLQKALAQNSLSAINSITSNQAMTPSYNSGAVSDLYANYKNKTGEYSDVGKAEAVNFGITQLSNVITNMNNAEQKVISNRIEMLEMQKSILTDEADIQANDEEILRQKLAMIDMQASQQAQQSGLGGITSGLTTAAIGGFNPVSVFLGLGQAFIGIFGANKAKQDAEYQKEMIRTQNELTGYSKDRNEIIKDNGDSISKYLVSLEDGVAIARKKAYDLQGGEKAFNDKVDKTSSDYDNTKSQFEDQFTSKTIYKVSTTDKEYNSYMSAYWDNVFKGGKISKELKRIKIEMSEEQETYLSTLKDSRDSLIQTQNEIENTGDHWAAYFGFLLELDEDNKIVNKGWQKRTDFLNQFVSDAKTGMMEIGSYASDFIGDSIASAFIRNDKLLSDALSDFEMQMETTALRLAADEAVDYVSIVDSVKVLKEEQLRLNTTTEKYVSGWLKAKGNISDVSSMIKYGLIEGITGALDETKFEDRFNNFGDTIGKTIGDSMKKSIIDANYSKEIVNIEDQMTQYLTAGTGINMSMIYDMAQEIQSLTSKTELDTLRIQSALSAFEIGDISYVNASQGVQYDVGTSTTTQYVFNNNVSTEIGNLISNTDKASLMKWANLFAPAVVEVIERDLGKKLS